MASTVFLSTLFYILLAFIFLSAVCGRQRRGGDDDDAGGDGGTTEARLRLAAREEKELAGDIERMVSFCFLFRVVASLPRVRTTPTLTTPRRFVSLNPHPHLSTTENARRFAETSGGGAEGEVGGEAETNAGAY
jgi:hypothetical protein